MAEYQADVYRPMYEQDGYNSNSAPIANARRNKVNRSHVVGVLAATVASLTVFSLSGVGMPIAEVTDANPEIAKKPIDDLVWQIKSVSDPTADICADPYASMCGKFDREYVLPKDIAIQTWGFNQVEDEMARQSMIPLQISCEDALASEAIDVWTSWMACSYQLCSNDGGYYKSEFTSPAKPTALHQYAPTVDAILRKYLPLLRLSSDEFNEISSSDHTAWKQFLGGYLGDLHNLGRHTFVKIHATPDVLFGTKEYDLKVEAGIQFYLNKDQYQDKTQVKNLKKYLKQLLTSHVSDIQGEVVDAKSINARVEKVISFEKAMAKIHLSEDDKRDQIAINNPSTVLLFNSQMDNILDITTFLSRQGVSNLVDVLVHDENRMVFENPNYIDELSDILSQFDRETQLDYLLLIGLDTVSQHLTKPFRDAASFWTNIQKGALPGDTETECRKWIADELPWIVGRDIVKAAKDSDIRRTSASQILTDIKQEYYDQVESSWWMDEESKVGARKKLGAMTQQVGWPEWLLNDGDDGYSAYFRKFYLNENQSRPDLPLMQEHLKYTEAEKKASAYLKMHLELMSADHRELVSRINKPIDLGIWSMFPQDVNAEYFATTNVFMLPWGVLQSPMMYPWVEGPYDSDQDRLDNLTFKAVSYGGIGSVVSHEIMHGFDDDGRTHDFQGLLKPFSTHSADKKFEQIIQCISDEYGSFTVEFDTVDGHKVKHLNGPMTQGENLADNGGLQTLTRLILSGKVIPKEDLEVSPLKRFGIDTTLATLPLTSFGTLWCEKSSAAFLEVHAETDPHAPGDKRIIGVFSNLTELSDHLKCPSGTIMNPNKRKDDIQSDLTNRNQCHVW